MYILYFVIHYEPCAVKPAVLNANMVTFMLCCPYFSCPIFHVAVPLLVVMDLNLYCQHQLQRAQAHSYGHGLRHDLLAKLLGQGVGHQHIHWNAEQLF